MWKIASIIFVEGSMISVEYRFDTALYSNDISDK